MLGQRHMTMVRHLCPLWSRDCWVIMHRGTVMTSVGIFRGDAVPLCIPVVACHPSVSLVLMAHADTDDTRITVLKRDSTKL